MITPPNCNIVSASWTVLQENSRTEHAVTNNVTLCYISITRCHNTTQHVLKVARTISLANKCNIMWGFLAVWPQDGINSTVWYAKEHIMAQMCHTVNSMAGRRTLWATADQHHQLVHRFASMLRRDVKCRSSHSCGVKPWHVATGTCKHNCQCGEPNLLLHRRDHVNIWLQGPQSRTKCPSVVLCRADHDCCSTCIRLLLYVDA
jgi:hypothetical protein